MMFNIVDYVIIGILVIIGISYLVKGFMKNALNDIFFIAVIIGAIFICPFVVKKLIGIDAIKNIGDSIQNSVSFLKKEGIGESILKIVLYIVSAIVIMLILGIIAKILKALLRKVIVPKKGVLKIVDRILGLVFGVAFYGLILLSILGSVNTIQEESIHNYLSGSFFSKNNIVAPYAEKYLNINSLIEGFTKDLDKDDEGSDGENGDKTEDITDENQGKTDGENQGDNQEKTDDENQGDNQEKTDDENSGEISKDNDEKNDNQSRDLEK